MERLHEDVWKREIPACGYPYDTGEILRTSGLTYQTILCHWRRTQRAYLIVLNLLKALQLFLVPLQRPISDSLHTLNVKEEESAYLGLC